MWDLIYRSREGRPVSVCLLSIAYGVLSMFRRFISCFSTVSLLSGCLISMAQTGASPSPGIAGPASSVPSNAAPVTERFDTLGLEGSDLEAAPPLVGEKAEYPEFTRELLQLQWRGGDPIDLYVIKPANVKNPPVILFLYGFPTDTDRFRNNEYCKTVTKDGFAAVGFVSALTGPRFHDRPMKEWFVSELQESLATSVHDVQMILNYLATRGDLDMGRVGMFGQGSGGTIAILAAAADPRLKAVDVLDPWGDWPEWLLRTPRILEEERKTYLTPAFEASIANLDPVKWLPKLNDRAFRLEETAFDPATPPAAKLRLKAALPPNAKYVRYDSIQDYKEHAASGGQILTWLHSQVNPTKVASSQAAAGAAP